MHPQSCVVASSYPCSNDKSASEQSRKISSPSHKASARFWRFTSALFCWKIFSFFKWNSKTNWNPRNDQIITTNFVLNLYQVMVVRIKGVIITEPEMIVNTFAWSPLPTFFIIIEVSRNMEGTHVCCEVDLIEQTLKVLNWTSGY